MTVEVEWFSCFVNENEGTEVQATMYSIPTGFEYILSASIRRREILTLLLPDTEVDIFTATSQKPSCLDFKTNLENVKLKCTIGPPPVLLYLPDDTSSTPAITAFFQTITELLSIAQGEHVCT
jgi:hypothetical protein